MLSVLIFLAIVAILIWIAQNVFDLFDRKVCETYSLDPDNLKKQAFRVTQNSSTKKWDLDIGTGTLGGDISYQLAGSFDDETVAKNYAKELLQTVRPVQILEMNLGKGPTPDKYEVIVRTI